MDHCPCQRPQRLYGPGSWYSTLVWEPRKPWRLLKERAKRFRRSAERWNLRHPRARPQARASRRSLEPSPRERTSRWMARSSICPETPPSRLEAGGSRCRRRPGPPSGHEEGSSFGRVEDLRSPRICRSRHTAKSVSREKSSARRFERAGRSSGRAVSIANSSIGPSRVREDFPGEGHGPRQVSSARRRTKMNTLFFMACPYLSSFCRFVRALLLRRPFSAEVGEGICLACGDMKDMKKDPILSPLVQGAPGHEYASEKLRSREFL